MHKTALRQRKHLDLTSDMCWWLTWDWAPTLQIHFPSLIHDWQNSLLITHTGTPRLECKGVSKKFDLPQTEIDAKDIAAAAARLAAARQIQQQRLHDTSSRKIAFGGSPTDISPEMMALFADTPNIHFSGIPAELRGSTVGINNSGPTTAMAPMDDKSAATLYVTNGLNAEAAAGGFSSRISCDQSDQQTSTLLALYPYHYTQKYWVWPSMAKLAANEAPQIWDPGYAASELTWIMLTFVAMIHMHVMLQWLDTWLYISVIVSSIVICIDDNEPHMYTTIFAHMALASLSYTSIICICDWVFTLSLCLQDAAARIQKWLHGHARIKMRHMAVIAACATVFVLVTMLTIVLVPALSAYTVCTSAYTRVMPVYYSSSASQTFKMFAPKQQQFTCPIRRFDLQCNASMNQITTTTLTLTGNHSHTQHRRRNSQHIKRRNTHMAHLLWRSSKVGHTHTALRTPDLIWVLSISHNQHSFRIHTMPNPMPQCTTTDQNQDQHVHVPNASTRYPSPHQQTRRKLPIGVGGRAN